MARVHIIGEQDVAKDLRAYLRSDPDLIVSPKTSARFVLTVRDAEPGQPVSVQTGPRVSDAEHAVIAMLAAAVTPILVEAGAGEVDENEIVIAMPLKAQDDLASAVALAVYKGLLKAALVSVESPPPVPLAAIAPASPPPPAPLPPVVLPPAPEAPLSIWRRIRRWFGAAVALALVLHAAQAWAQGGGQATIQARDLSSGVIVPNVGDSSNNAIRVNVVAGSGSGVSGTVGAAVPSTVAPIGVRDNSGNLAYPKLDASGNLLVAVTGAGSGGTSSTDGSAYTAGTTAGTPAMFVFDDTATTACAEDKTCIARLTAQRAIHVNFRNAAGTEIGTSSNPIQVTLANTGANTNKLLVTPDLPSGASTAAKQPALGTAGTASADVITVQGIASMTPLLTTLSGTNNLNNISGTISLPTGAATAAKQPALGTAGSPSTDVISVQGVASGTAMPISAASLPLPSTAATSTKQSDGSQKTQIVDGSGNVVGATSNALDVNIKSGNPTTMTVTQGTGTNLHIVCDSGCSSSAGFADNGAFTFGTTAVNPIAGVFDDASPHTATEDSAAIARITQNKALHVNFRDASGTEIGTSSNPIQVSLANTAANSTAVKVDNSAVTQPVSGSLTVTQGTGTNLHVVCDSGCSSSTAPADNSAFTAGTTSSSPISAFYHSTVDTVTDGRIAAVGMDSKRNLFNVIRDAAGNARGANVTASNALVVDGSAVTQPVSAASLPLPSGASTLAEQQTQTTALQLIDNLPNTLGSTTSGQSGALALGAVTTAAPSYTTAQSNALSLTTAGALRVDGSGATQPVSGTVSITANSAINVAQLAGTTTDTNSGTKSAGTLRVVLATDQPQLTNKLLVTPDANSAVNISQMNGVTVTMGNGTSGTGVQRVAIASDNSAVSGFGVGATGSAPPANASYMAGIGGGATNGLLTGVPVCDSQAFLDMTTATTTELVALTASQTIHICHIRVTANGATTMTFKRGTGSNCGTGTTAIDNAIELTAQTGYVAGIGFGEVLNGGASANAVCVTNSAAVNLHVFVRYAKY